jgi:hypothetical protein
MSVQENHDRLRAEATLLAGAPGDLVQRASVYLHLYRHSSGNHVFPLIAAHGALWGAGHFRRGTRIGRVLAACLPRAERTRRLAQVEAFATAFKDINRRVCIETSVAYHLTRLHGDDPALHDLIDPGLVDALNACHAATRAGRAMHTAEKHALFTAFFQWEQDTIVGPAVTAAIAEFEWPLMRMLALRPPIGFRYFHPAEWLWFRKFDSKAERITRGQQAFAIAAQQGWAHVEATLDRYRIMPTEALQTPETVFSRLVAQFDVSGMWERAAV